jgi:hypothetical protein
MRAIIAAARAWRLPRVSVRPLSAAPLQGVSSVPAVADQPEGPAEPTSPGWPPPLSQRCPAAIPAGQSRFARAARRIPPPATRNAQWLRVQVLPVAPPGVRESRRSAMPLTYVGAGVVSVAPGTVVPGGAGSPVGYGLRLVSRPLLPLALYASSLISCPICSVLRTRSHAKRTPEAGVAGQPGLTVSLRHPCGHLTPAGHASASSCPAGQPGERTAQPKRPELTALRRSSSPRRSGDASAGGWPGQPPRGFLSGLTISARYPRTRG